MNNPFLLQFCSQEQETKIITKKNQNEPISNRQNKKITFNNIVSAILIPSIKDMDAEIRSTLWWNEMDYKDFYISSKAEIAFFLKMHKDLKQKDAVRLLYQHSMICYEPYMM
jgi:hypothetical protein